MALSPIGIAIIALGLTMLLWGVDKIFDFTGLTQQQRTRRLWAKFWLGVVYFIIGVFVIFSGVILA